MGCFSQGFKKGAGSRRPVRALSRGMAGLAEEEDAGIAQRHDQGQRPSPMAKCRDISKMLAST